MKIIISTLIFASLSPNFANAEPRLSIVLNNSLIQHMNIESIEAPRVNTGTTTKTVVEACSDNLLNSSHEDTEEKYTSYCTNFWNISDNYQSMCEESTLKILVDYSSDFGIYMQFLSYKCPIKSFGYSYTDFKNKTELIDVVHSELMQSNEIILESYMLNELKNHNSYNEHTDSIAAPRF